MSESTIHVLGEVAAERRRQESKFPNQQLPDGTSSVNEFFANIYRAEVERQAAAGQLTWLQVLEEEFAEASAETDAASLRIELIQVAAVAVRWVEAIDARMAVSEGRAA